MERVYPTRAYRDIEEPRAGDVVRLRRDNDTDRGSNPSFDDCIIVSIAPRGEEAVELARPHAHLTSDGMIVVDFERFHCSLERLLERFWVLTTGLAGRRENRLRPVPPHFTVLVPWSETPTRWHPTEKTGPFSELCRGNFSTIGEAASWALEHLEGQPYSIRYTDPMADPETRAAFEKLVGYRLDLGERAREAHK